MTTLITATRRGALALAAGGALAPLLVSRPAFAQAAPEEYMRLMLEAGAFTKGAAEIALEKAENEMARQFAELEIAEIDAVVAVLTGAGAPPPPSADELDGAEAEMIAQLRDAEAGPDFDRLFVEAEITGHEEGLAIQQPLSGETEITVPVASAKLAEESIKSHIAMLRAIQGMLA